MIQSKYVSENQSIHTSIDNRNDLFINRPSDKFMVESTIASGIASRPESWNAWMVESIKQSIHASMSDTMIASTKFQPNIC